MSVNLKIDLDFNQVKNIIDQLPFDEQEKLAEYLDDKTLFAQWSRVKEELKDIPVTFEEITEEVEAVREKMYREGSRVRKCNRK